MTLDWKLLVRVREQQRTRAQQRVAEERQATLRAQGQAHAAREAWSQEVQARAGLWVSMQGTGQGEGPALDIGTLRHASAWSRTLDGRIGQASALAAQAEGDALRQGQRLADSRQALRGAAGALHKAEQMHDRVRDDHLRQQQLRADDALEEAAVQAWSRRTVGR
jgi:hypothetical protein